MHVSPQPPTRVRKGLIILWAIAGAVAGWLIAAREFLRGRDEFNCVLVSLAVMLIATLYASRDHRQLYARIVFAILFGGLFVSFLSPRVSERVGDRFVLILRGFGAGGFSEVPWGLAGVMLFLGVLLGVTPSSQPEVDGSSTSLHSLNNETESRNSVTD